MSVNKVIILGRLGQDPELKYTPNGMGVCNFSCATSEHWTDKGSGQRQERTEWHRIVVWGKLAETCNQYLAKGRQVYLEGRIQTRSWDDKEGNKRYSTEIVANTIQFIGGQQQAGSTATQGDQNKAPQAQAAGSAPDQGNGMMDKNYNISTDSNFTADDIPF